MVNGRPESPLILAMFREMGDGAKLRGARIACHLPALYTLARHWSFGHVVECGVGRGYSTAALLAAVVETGAHLTSIDIQSSCRDGALGTMGLDKDDRRLLAWTFLARDSVQAASEFAQETVGFFFLDTQHTLDLTRRELAAWLPKIHPRGLIAGHDFFPNPEWPDRGVMQAVHEFVEQHHDRFALQVLEHDQGLFILWPKA